MQSRSGQRAIILVLGAVLFAVGAFPLYLTFPHGGERLVSATRVRHSSGEDEICTRTPGRCLYIVELRGIAGPNPCRDSANLIWRDGACWSAGTADEFPVRRESIEATLGIAMGDNVKVVFDPNRPDHVRLSGLESRVIPFVFMAGGLAVAVSGAWWFRRQTSSLAAECDIPVRRD